jgi:hypothetical protein
MSTWERLKGWLGMESRKQLDWMLEQCNKWKPKVTYDDEIETRVQYLDDDMRDDMLALIEDEFKKTKELFPNHIITLPFVAHVAEKRARYFEGSRFELRDKETKQVIPPETKEAQTFAALIEQAELDSVLDRAGRVMDTCRMSIARPWWDQDHVAVSTYSPDRVPIVPNTNREWDPYSALAVLFERDGAGGFEDEPRYEVFAVRALELAAAKDDKGSQIFEPAMHYITSRNQGDKSLNDGDANPFRDPVTKKAIYPFARFTANKGAIYSPGGNGLVEFNRILNLALTQMQMHSCWGLMGYPIYRKDPTAGSVTLPATRPMSPKQAIELPPGVTLEFVRNDIPIEKITNTYQLMIQMNSLLRGLDPATIKLDSTAPQSGYGLKVSFAGLANLVKKNRPIIAPDVNRLINLIILIWNYYQPTVKDTWMVQIPPTMVAAWCPGQLDAGPVDDEQLTRYYPKMIEEGAATVDNWVSERQGVDMVTAKKIVDDNLKRNAEIKKLNTRYPAEPQDGVKEAIEKLKGKTNQNEEEPEDEEQPDIEDEPADGEEDEAPKE